ncbi:NADH:ubiquinone oxidoreductase subunit B14.5a [Popillia japonica]|uniref:NADH dehydrogenase [ubiquinone] 1 alpha subcomplex subunit 7 n=1 Tax=Popillia japonica TaxID=7064 RepID=A0AAW1N4K6_POPJA
MGKGDFRDICPLLQRFRNFLLGRQHTKALRFSPEVATRSPPLPNLPDGPSHRLFNNYYYSRDGRREVAPPAVINTQNRIGSCESEGAVISKKGVTPGPVYSWD